MIFQPFVGVAPRQYMRLFTKMDRKTADGRVRRFVAGEAQMRYKEESAVYLEREEAYAAILKTAMNKQGNLFGL